jgi:tetratricopeptide (TPR) repeat protein
MRKADSGLTTQIPVWLSAATALALFARIACAMMEIEHPPKPTTQIMWKDAEQIDLKSGKLDQYDPLVLYYFTAKSSGACEKFERNCWCDPNIVSLVNEKFLPVKLVDRNQEEHLSSPAVQHLESRYFVSAFPTLVVARQNDTDDENPIKFHAGAMDRDDTRHFLESSIQKVDYRHGQMLLAKGEFLRAANSFDTYLKRFSKSDIKEYDNWIPHAVLLRYACLTLSGQEPAAKSLATEYMPELSKDWPYPILRYLNGETNYDTLVRDAGDWDNQRFEMHTFVGIHLFAQGKMLESRKHLEQALSMDDYHKWYEYKLARFLMNEINKKTDADSKPVH